jgi:hypothetical protein
LDIPPIHSQLIIYEGSLDRHRQTEFFRSKKLLSITPIPDHPSSGSLRW